MRVEDIPAYAAHVIGFPVHAGMKVLVEEECIGEGPGGVDIVSSKGAEAEILSVQLKPYPDQLSILLRVVVDSDQNTTIEEWFTEGDPEPIFPFVLPKTQEQIELERAEAAARKEAQVETNAAPNPASSPAADAQPTTEALAAKDTSSGKPAPAPAVGHPQQHQSRRPGPWEDEEGLGPYRGMYPCG